MKYVIDRIEENRVIVEVESGKAVSLPLELIPTVKEGDSIIITIERKSEGSKADTRSIFEKLRNK